MINFKILNFDSGVLSVEKAGKPLQFKIGEVVNAEVLENLPSGSIELKIKGSVVTAETSIPMEKDSIAYFKVTSLPVDGQQLALKYLGSEPKAQLTDPKAQALGTLMKSLTAAVESGSGKVDSALIQSLLKSLPEDVAEIPRDIRAQLQNLLTNSLKSTGRASVPGLAQSSARWFRKGREMQPCRCKTVLWLMWNVSSAVRSEHRSAIPRCVRSQTEG